MGPKAGGGKKAKGLTPEEIAAKEEEARKEKEKEDKRLAEEQRQRELEEAKLKAHLKAVREEEFARLTEELKERVLIKQKSEVRLKKEMAVQAAEAEWAKFREALDEVDSSNERELNTFCALCAETTINSLADSIDLIRRIETVATTVRNRWSDCLADGDAEGQSRCLSYLTHFSKTVTELIDRGTACYLRNPPPAPVERGGSSHGAGEKDIHVEEIASNVMVAMWASLTDRPGNRKSVQFEKLGVQLDIPKQVFAAGKLVHRVARMSMETFNLHPYGPAPADAAPASGERTPSMYTSNKIVVGDLYVMEILFPQKESHTIVSRKWVMKDNSAASFAIQRSQYPSSVACRCFLKVPDTVVMSNDVRIAVWNEEGREWVEDGIAEYQYSESTRTVQFHLTCVGTFALVKNRTVDLPYKRWAITPHRDLSQSGGGSSLSGKLARLSVTVGAVDLTIGVSNSKCHLAKTNSKALLDLMNVHMTPGVLLTLLQNRGVNLLPCALDATRTPGLSSYKHAVELSVLEEVARTVSSFEYQSSPWNQQLTSEYQVGICARESTTFTAREEKFDLECVLAEEDSKSETACNAPDVANLPTEHGIAVKYTLVMGNEYGDKKHYSVVPRPGEVTHMMLSTCMEARVTPEALERVESQSDILTDVVYKLLRLVKPYSYS